jgi:tetratricopeptide (TPR) repeat protein
MKINWRNLISGPQDQAPKVPAQPAETGQDEPAQDIPLDDQVLILYKLGKYAEAIPIARKCLEFSEMMLGRDHPETARDLNNLAEVYSRTGDYKKAEPLYQRALLRHVSFRARHRSSSPARALTPIATGSPAPIPSTRPRRF